MSDAEGWGVGDKADAKAFATALVGQTVVELIQGQHPHSRSYDNVYARFPDGRIEAFDGHRTLVSIQIEESNYLKQSDLSGDEVRKSCVGRIFFDFQPVFAVDGRTAENVLRRIANVLPKLEDSTFLRIPEHERIGRRVYYKDVPGVITMWLADQGCVVIEPAPGCEFPRPAWAQEDSGGMHYEGAYAKVEILSPDVWWWRTKLVDGEHDA